MKRRKIILASSSPRRIELLKACNLSFKVLKPDIDETRLGSESARVMVKRLSREKALAVCSKMRGQDWVILAADTCVVTPWNGRVLGKPRNAADACKMLQMIQSQTHVVLTGYTLLGPVDHKIKVVSAVVSSQVKIRALSRSEIKNYVATGEPMDKAGAYAAQGIGMAFVEAIRGSYTNVVGLPLHEVLRDLKQHFGVRSI